MNKTARSFLVTTAIVVGTLYAGAWRADADFIQTNLVSDIPGLATITDPLLINPWGISHSATSPFWTSNQGTNTSTLYAVTANNAVTQVTAVNANGLKKHSALIGSIGPTPASKVDFSPIARPTESRVTASFAGRWTVAKSRRATCATSLAREPCGSSILTATTRVDA
jgi:hypothetical protein